MKVRAPTWRDSLLATTLFAPPRSQSLREPLSARELQVLQLIANGYSNREIAGMLVVGIGTVKTHANNIFGKLNAANRTQAVRNAREAGLLD